ncbi:MAG TPA: Rrf2 family transcriptional regulator [Rubrivivax sp.]|nr:Rrf2 family transcriptional regulator [Rubrivivax sp.]
MRLTDYTDYTMRVLMYCAAHPDRLVTVNELAQEHGISRHHLTKIVTDLGRQGLLQTVRGRGGGMRLSVDPARIRVADVVRTTETDFRLVECFDARSNRCPLTPTCRLKGLLESAMDAYFEVLEGRTLADLVAPDAAKRGAARAPDAAAPIPVRSARTTRPTPLRPRARRSQAERADA